MSNALEFIKGVDKLQHRPFMPSFKGIGRVTSKLAIPAVLIIVISVMSGFDHDLREKILGFKPHLTIVQWNPEMRSAVPMRNFAAVSDTVAKNPNVLGVAPFITGPVLVETEGGTNRPALQDAPMLRGIDLASENKAGDILRNLVAGTNDLSGRGLLVGIDFASNLGLMVGDRLSIYSARELKKMKTAREQKQDAAILPDEYEVRGIYDAGYYEFNARFVVVSLENAQELYDLGDDVHGLFVTLKNPDNAEVVKQRIYSCKQQLAADVLPLPSTPAAQKQLENLAETNRLLQAQIAQLNDSVKKWSDYATSLQAGRPSGNVAGQQPDDLSYVPAGNPVTPTPARQTTTSSTTSRSRTHVVVAGETLASIARKHGVSLAALQAANPGVTPKQLKVGQTIKLPGQ